MCNMCVNEMHVCVCVCVCVCVMCVCVRVRVRVKDLCIKMDSPSSNLLMLNIDAFHCKC